MSWLSLKGLNKELTWKFFDTYNLLFLQINQRNCELQVTTIVEKFAWFRVESADLNRIDGFWFKKPSKSICESANLNRFMADWKC